MDATTEVIIAFGIISVFALVGYLEIKFMRSKREGRLEAAILKDDAHNALITATAFSKALQGQKRNTSEADNLIFQAGSAYEMGEYRSCIELSDRAKNVLKNSRTEDIFFDLSKENGGVREESVPALQAAKKLPANYLEAKFIIGSVKDRVEQLKGEVSEDIIHDLNASEEAFDKEDYTGSLKFAMKAKRSLEPKAKNEIPAAPEIKDKNKVSIPATESGPGSRACSDCGAQVNEDDEFCFSCGAKVDEKKCPKCSAIITQGDKFCRKCGTNMPPTSQETAK